MALVAFALIMFAMGVLVGFTLAAILAVGSQADERMGYD